MGRKSTVMCNLAATLGQQFALFVGAGTGTPGTRNIHGVLPCPSKSIKTELDDLIEHQRGAVLMSSALYRGHTIAVKTVDDGGIESLRVMEVG